MITTAEFDQLNLIDQQVFAARSGDSDTLGYIFSLARTELNPFLAANAAALDFNTRAALCASVVAECTTGGADINHRSTHYNLVRYALGDIMVAESHQPSAPSMNAYACSERLRPIIY